MTNKDIQQLIDRYLNGKTTPEEERMLAQELLREDLPSEWQAIRLMLGELVMGEAEYDAMMAKRLQTANHIVRMKWRWTAATACLLLLVGTGTMILMKKGDTTPLVAQKMAQPLSVVTDLTSPASDIEIPQTTPLPPIVADLKSATQETGDFKFPSTTPSPSVESSAEVFDSSSPSAEEPNLHYASLETNTDTIPYQDPARVDEFIEKLAAYYEVKQGELKCSQPMDSTVVSTVYVFPDKKEIDVFSRLLQVACWYSDETPGYHLNFSHCQFFFELKDMRKQLLYRWIAERVNGKILLYSTCSPIEVVVSSPCYLEYLDELMHTKSINPKTLDI
jgi:hypothetical protein